ncbi:MAG: OmpA family protein [Oscillospiraceae bacterium]|nr:OmpA family protein [Oscillospiraceae bacterium]
MKRTYAGRSSALAASSEGEQGFWPSYADMMSAVALILFFLMLLSYIQNLITGNDLQNTQEVLAETRLTLSDTQTQLDLTLAQVEEATNELDRVTIDLAEAQLTLDEQKGKLDEQNAQLAEQKNELAAQDKLLADQKALIGEQEQYVKAANKELLEMRSRMQTIAVLRLSILEQIRDSVVAVMGDASKVSIGDNGAIVLDEGVLFDFGSSAIKAGARPTLDRLVEVFKSFLSDSENAKYVDSIIISGHTDSIGSDAENRELSTDRANAVLNYLLTADRGSLNKYAQYFCAAGYGATRPVASNETDEGRAQNRRIEISITLRDDTIMDIVESYLELDLPSGADS